MTLSAAEENQANMIRGQTTALTERAFSNTIEFGQKLARAKGSQELIQFQSEFLARQAQTLADGTKEFSEQMQQATDNFASNVTKAMEEGSRRADQAVSNLSARAEHLSRRQQQRARSKASKKTTTEPFKR